MIAYFGGPLESDFDAYYDTVSCNVQQHVGREILSRYIALRPPLLRGLAGEVIPAFRAMRSVNR
jgi:hypothetical protein